MPRISEKLRKDLLLESLRQRVRHLYIYGESHPAERELIVSRLDGFMEAAFLIRICSRDEAQRLIDEEHYAIFGTSRAERIALSRQHGLSDTPDWSPYDAPATERMSLKRRRARRYGAKTRAPMKRYAGPKSVDQMNG